MVLAGSGMTSGPAVALTGLVHPQPTLGLISKGPFGTGRTFTGTWQTLSLILRNCRSYLQSAPSCTFYPV